MALMKRLRLDRFDRSRRGVAGIEFAMTASVLVILIIGITDLGSLLLDRRDMRSALQSGGQYFMVGGVDMDEARRAIEGSWTSRGDDVVIEIDRICYCGGVEHACTANCPDSSLPETFHVISATARLSGMLMEYEHVVQETVRVR